MTYTEFAPAERSSRKEVNRQSGRFSRFPHLQSFCDFIPDGVMALNSNRQIVFANRTAVLYGAAREIDSVLGLRPGELLNCIHSSESEGGCGTTVFCSTCGAVKSVLSGLRGEEDIQECSITQKDSGDTLDLRVWTTPLAIEGEQFVFFVVKDVSDEKRRRILERIFFHDIMNTAGVLRGYSEILRNAGLNEIEEFRESIYKRSSRLIEEINAQRDLLAAENRELSAHPVQIDSIELLTEIADSYRNHEVGEDRHIIVNTGAQQVSFNSDRALLSRVISNMIKNALEASKAGDTVTISCKTVGKEIQFSVHNPGFIPPEIQLQIFKRSFSTKEPGRGLGTYSMRLLSERYLQGSVSFTSSEEQGTEFMARYPLILKA